MLLNLGLVSNRQIPIYKKESETGKKAPRQAEYASPGSVSYFAVKYAFGKDDISIWSVFATIVNILTVMLLSSVAKKEGMSFKELINYRKDQIRIKALPLVIGFAAVGTAGMYLAGLVCYGTVMPEVSVKLMAPIPPFFAIINLVLLPVTTALAEDGLYLGAGAGRIDDRYAAVIAPAFFYALQHCFIPAIFDGRYMVYRFLSFLPLTVLFCLYYRKKKDPVPVMISHVLLDLATAGMILYTSVVPGAYEQMCSVV